MKLKKEVIKSLNNPYIKQCKKLHNKKYRQQGNEFLIEGHHLVDMAKEAHTLKTVIAGPGQTYNFKKVIYVEQKIINYLATTITPQGIMGVAFLKPKLITYEESFVVLENISDPGNLGTMLRNALAFGFNNVVLTNNCVDITSPKVIRSAQGAIFKLNIFHEETTIAFLKKFKGVKIATSLDKGASPMEKLSLNQENFCIIFGNESQGVLPQTLALVDHKFKINMENIDSLNVAVASGIFLNHLRKK